MNHVSKLAAMVVILCASVTQAAVSMPSVFSDHMVFQRGKPVPVRYAYTMNPDGCNLYNKAGLPRFLFFMEGRCHNADGCGI
jgi:hypothetical protein